MATGPLHGALRLVRRLSGREGGAAPDGQLLGRFVDHGDGTAFAALVQRHGGLVLGVCRRLLPDPHDADDAFQATFLVLMRKARSLGRREPVGSWLYGVAYRVALKARSANARRHARERPLAEDVAQGPAGGGEGQDLGPVLAEEVGRLPAKYRQPVVLCYLEGETNEGAARQLGWPAGTVKCRLARARELLRRRLARRGVALADAGVVAALAPGAAAVPTHLLASLIKIAAGHAAAGLVSARAAALCEGMVRDMFVMKLKTALAVLLAVGVAGLGAGTALRRAPGTEAADGALAFAAAPPPAEKSDEPPEVPVDAAARKRAAQMRKDLAAAVGDRFEVLGGTYFETTTNDRYWLARLRAKRPGEFVLRCDVTYERPRGLRDAPPEGGPYSVRVTWSFDLAIGKRGASRVHAYPGAHSAYPLACVGDTLLVPIRVNPTDTRHTFRMPAKLAPEDELRFKIAREVADADRGGLKRSPGGGVEARNRAADVLTWVKGGARSSSYHAGPRRYHHLDGCFDARAPGKFDLVIVLDRAAARKAGGEALSAEQKLSLHVVGKGRPLTTLVRQWQAFDRTEAIASYPYYVAHPLRVGDRLVVYCGGYDTPGPGDPAKHPTVEVTKRPFKSAEGRDKPARKP